MKRVTWSSRTGFIFAVAGSAVGLANIWRLPYIIGEHGGSAFLIVYLLCLLLIGFPVFMAEMLIGRTTQTSPSGAFQKLGGSYSWSFVGKMTIATGLIVSSFYSAVAGWILGYLVEGLKGSISSFQEPSDAILHYTSLIENPLWGVGFHLLFLLICVAVLYLGVRKGIERGNKIMMPCLLFVLVLLVIKGLSLPNSIRGIRYLLSPDWSQLTPAAIMMALGQSFFTLSLGQGTMVTYGSYLNKRDNLIKNCLPVIAMDTLVSLLSAIAVFAIVFSGGMEPNSGPGLLFHTLPVIFSQISGGYFVAVAFFLLVFLAAITSQISAMEPAIAYLIDERGWQRRPAVIACGAGVFLLGIPSALSYSLLKQYTLFGASYFDSISFFASSILIPLGGFFAVILVGWVWGISNALQQLKQGAAEFFKRNPWLRGYFWFCFKYSAPILMIIVFLNALGIFD
ncbi:MAG: sodium-dependent transporter [Waddliaceae bacterium]